MLDRWDIDFYLQRERHELALAEASCDPGRRALHRGMAISYRQRALRAGFIDVMQSFERDSEEDSHPARTPRAQDATLSPAGASQASALAR